MFAIPVARYSVPRDFSSSPPPVSVRTSCRYQTLVCSLITTPPASFLLRSFGLTTISSIVTREKNRKVRRPRVVCSRPRWSYNIPGQGENLGKLSIKEKLKKRVRRQWTWRGEGEGVHYAVCRRRVNAIPFFLSWSGCILFQDTSMSAFSRILKLKVENFIWVELDYSIRE